MQRKLVERELTQEGPVEGSENDGAKGKRRTATVNLAESPISWLHSRGHLETRLFDAGERLRADFERAQMGPSVTMLLGSCARQINGRGFNVPFRTAACGQTAVRYGGGGGGQGPR